MPVCEESEQNRTRSREATAGLPSLWYKVAAVVFTSAALLVPCFWHSRVQAGDLGSHVYNAWLADQIRTGGLPGLALVQPWTNFLFDRVLSALIHLTGYGTGQQIAVSLVVLIFFWGAFRFVAALSGAPAWPVAPLLAVLTYGWTFHAGFFNYLLGMGLSLWAITLLLRPHAPRILGAITLMGLASGRARAGLRKRMRDSRISDCRAQSYLGSAEYICSQRRSCALSPADSSISSLFPTRWSPTQLINLTGMDQAWVFGLGYCVLVPVLVVVMLSVLERSRGIADTAVQLWLLAAASVVLIPTTIYYAPFGPGLSFISDRSSLITGVLFLAVAVGAKSRVGTNVFPWVLSLRSSSSCSTSIPLRSTAWKTEWSCIEHHSSRQPRRARDAQFEGTALIRFPHDRSCLHRPMFQLCKLRSLDSAVPRAYSRA